MPAKTRKKPENPNGGYLLGEHTETVEYDSEDTRIDPDETSSAGFASEMTGNAEDRNRSGGENGSGAKQGYVKYCLPYLPGKQPGDSHTVTVNGRNYQVQYGEQVEIPAAVRDILEEMIAQSRLVLKKMRQMKDNDQCIAKFE